MESSIFGRLAPELRNRVYELVLTSSTPFNLVLSHTHQSLRQQPKSAKTAPLALTATCKSIRAEATPLFYGSNTFKFLTEHVSYADNISLFQGFQRQIGDRNARALRSITFDVGLIKTDFLFALISRLLKTSSQDGKHTCEFKVQACLRYRFDYRLLDPGSTSPMEPDFPLVLDVGELKESFAVTQRAIEESVRTVRWVYERDELAVLSENLKRLEGSLLVLSAYYEDVYAEG